MCAHSIHSFLKSLAIVIPVFYNVNPSDLRWTNKDGQYAWLNKEKAHISDHFSNKKWEIEAPRDCLQVVSWNCRGYPWIRDSGLGPITKGTYIIILVETHEHDGCKVLDFEGTRKF